MDKTIYKGDDTSAFGHNFIKIIISNPYQRPISKIIFSVNGGIITKEFTDENNFTTDEIELYVNFNSAETAQLSGNNVGFMVAYDENHKKRTCYGTMTFKANNGVIYV